MWCPICRGSINHSELKEETVCPICGAKFILLSEGQAPKWLRAVEQKLDENDDK